MATCPYCKTLMNGSRIVGMDASEGPFAKKSFKAIAHCCPSCDAVFSVEIDPIALKTDIINGILKGMRSG